jgi:hypothetical protein
MGLQASVFRGVVPALLLGAAVLVPRSGPSDPDPGTAPDRSGPPAFTLAGGGGERATWAPSSLRRTLQRAAPSDPVPDEALTAVVRRTCAACHNDQLQTANLSLQDYRVEGAVERAETTEKMIAKLRANMMPPPGIPRPGGDTLLALVEALEKRIDEAGAENPGFRSFQRLNRAEYERAILDLLGIEVDAASWLPPDMRMANFDNIVDVQMLSPTVVNAYLNAAAEISRIALGDPDAARRGVTYTNSGYLSQWERVDGAPYGTRGGMAVVHPFPADGEYVFVLTFEQTTTGEGYPGQIARFEQLEVSIDGERVALLDVDQWMSVSDPGGIAMRTEPVFVRAGPRRVAAAFLKRAEGPFEDLLSPHAWSLADRHTGIRGYGITQLPHLRDLIVDGPFEPRGVSESPVHGRLLACRPTAPEEERPCAEETVLRLATRAFRRPVGEAELGSLMRFYEEGAEEGDFAEGVRMALQAILASPRFFFRLERQTAEAGPGEVYPVSDLDLASRLSFFLWALPPDDELIAVAREGRLSEPAVLEAQARRMLGDPRAEALATRFAAQWLRLHDLDAISPDAFWFPDFDEQLRGSMRRETELLFHDLVRRDGNFLELFTADYTFVNERLALHYGIPGVRGQHFRRVRHPHPHRVGIFGHGSVLTSTSHANRTSPTDRGKWVMEVLLGTPPPPPPPVPALDETAAVAEDGRRLTTRERLEIHRANPTCNSCHQFMDPIGLALDNFDVTGQWRIRERDLPLDTRGTLYDGTPVSEPRELVEALLQRPIPLVRTFAENLLAYALGRQIEWYDRSTIRAIARRAEAHDYRMSHFILGVIESAPFRMQRVPESLAEAEERR